MQTLLRATALAVLAPAALFLVACGGGGDDDESNGATQEPAAEISATPRPTLPPISTRAPDPTPTPAPSHPAGTRTEIEAVDDVLEAVEAGEPDGLSAQLSFHPYPCNNADAVGAAPCPDGVAEGTEVDVVSFAACEGGFLTRETEPLSDTVARFLDGEGETRAVTPRVYAVVEPLAGRIATPFPISHMIIFASAHTLLLDDAGITHLGFPCGSITPEQLYHPADDPVLEPPAR